MPDIPLEETGPIRDVATAAGLELVLLTTPTTPQPRMEAIAKASQGFVYLVSVTGGLKWPSMLLRSCVLPLRGGADLHIRGHLGLSGCRGDRTADVNGVSG